jgi:murein DD-endopeptidase MepM/ murein hydrolase activator NlpD
MKKLYYFSRSKLQFVEIKNYKTKLATYFSIAVLMLSSVILGAYSFLTSITSSGYNNSRLRKENKLLKNKLLELGSNYKLFNKELDSLTNVNNDLRIAANLPPISKDLQMVGVGGGSFNNSIDFLNDIDNLKLKKALSLFDEVSRKIKFEKSNFFEISKKLKENKLLYESLPAIKPCDGTIGDGFGMRYHPILHVWRMHAGVDIVADVGTPVHATGNGSVEFVGYTEGYGLCVKINHGFGYETLYGHLSRTTVKVGKKVSRGDVIAKTGNTGLSTGPHLHYEVEHDGVKENPIQFFFDDLKFFDLASRNN